MISWTIFYAVTVKYFKKSLLSPEFWIGNSRIQIFSNSQMQTRSKINSLTKLSAMTGNSKLHNVCKFQGKISRTFPFIVRKPGAAEGRIAMRKSRNSNFRKCHVTFCKRINSYRFQPKFHTAISQTIFYAETEIFQNNIFLSPKSIENFKTMLTNKYGDPKNHQFNT